ncbi:hypothetical protein MC7420_6971 [Coleofasciculus chthonoplastes PCC 7420]|uniref:Uncharacterized protein n=1 Tax=Coleofasciculus chthonoplastes PCC 7420 TaxID=118168 RepID=B4W1S8_9CYAN|nr:hypothetical protein MC7420_6971 [Coleofasciculus chthonoplastes PCC 7420]
MRYIVDPPKSHKQKKRSIRWLPPFEGGREGDLKGDFDLLYFITAQSDD